MENTLEEQEAIELTDNNIVGSYEEGGLDELLFARGDVGYSMFVWCEYGKSQYC